MKTDEPAIRCTEVSRRFGATVAVDDVSLTIPAGEIHALVGANGAGKSTLLGMLSGRVAPSEGTLEIFGHKLHGGRPREARDASVAIVYQELTIVPQLSAYDNVFLGEERRKAGFIDEASMKKRFKQLCQEFEVEIDAGARAGKLTVATQQLLEIMRTVQRGTRVLLLDEPTASLSHREREFLLAIIRRLKREGVTIVFVSHNLDEVLEISDTVTVMRNAQLIATRAVAEWTKPSMVEEMTGEGLLRVERDGEPVEGPWALEARDINLAGAIQDVSLQVRAGEVLGIAGLVGAGRTSLLRCLAGLEPNSSGELFLDGEKRRWPRSPREALHKLEIALLPEDRKGQALALHMSIPDNVMMGNLASVSSGGLISNRAQLDRARKILDAFKLNRQVGRYPVAELSGGNQQKVVLAKYINEDPRVMLFDEPTRGIDVGAKVEVLHAVREFAHRGKAVIITSAEIGEVLDVSDRVLVMALGQIVGEFAMHTETPSVRNVLDRAFQIDDPTAPVISEPRRKL